MRFWLLLLAGLGVALRGAWLGWRERPGWQEWYHLGMAIAFTNLLVTLIEDVSPWHHD